MESTHHCINGEHSPKFTQQIWVQFWKAQWPQQGRDISNDTGLYEHSPESLLNVVVVVYSYFLKRI